MTHHTTDGAASRPENHGLFSRARQFFAILGGIYVLVVVLLAIPLIQSHVLYMNALKLPWGAQFDAPEKYGLAPGKTTNVKITTADNVTLGAWFVLSDTLYHELPFPPQSSATKSHIPVALRTHPTILFFHGNGATRALSTRVRYYSAFSSRLKANVLAIDYRGYGDSEGAPSEVGLATDARAAWDWLMSYGTKAEDILIIGHSLGTAVASSLTVNLSDSGVQPKGTVLMSPFSSIYNLVDTYLLFGLFPVMLPLTLIPRAAQFYKSFLVHEFDTLSAITRMQAPLLIVHAENDWDIQHAHSDALFDALLELYLPPLNSPPLSPGTWSKGDWKAHGEQLKRRKEVRDSLLTETNIPNFGSLNELNSGEVRIVLLKTLEGSHNHVGTLEGVQDVIRNVFSLP
ncbi:Alpha/Beta hydrolase protein [Hygrophoropsis aurantiaca]|uniref:Alpha/Beta hydrolase protein n=1 Tax=Hygrophoropsis aurantiaca TaxID=72124 RepID=A0ACB8AJL4_9AGAM|nr:Alpha/Beta hydrolase protein [Hygrophoropsis aurantiaca]